MFGTMLMVAVAHGAPPPSVEAGFYFSNGRMVVVGKGAKSLQWDADPGFAVKPASPYLLVDAFNIGWPVITIAGATWFPDALVVGEDVYTGDGQYRWEASGCIPTKKDQSPVDCAVDAAGVRTVGGGVLYLRAPGVWTSTMTPAFRGATAEEARRLARDAFVDATANAVITRGDGNWFSANGDAHVVTGGVWTENGGAPRTMKPLAPCLVETVEDGRTYSAVWWSDGTRAAVEEVAVAVGDVVWGCGQDDMLLRFEGATCESWSWSSPDEADPVGHWGVFPGLCGGSKAAPGTFRGAFAPTDVPGLHTGRLLSSENPFPSLVDPPADR